MKKSAPAQGVTSSMQHLRHVKLTIATAVRNAIDAGRRDSLVRCVESVSRLKADHEHVIYDGRSTDGTVALLRELEARTPGLKVISEIDTGIYNALNKGIRDARGEWFYVIGCDDFISDPEVLDRVLAVHADSDVIVTPVKCGDKVFQFESMESLKWILWEMPYCHQGVVMKTAQCRRLGGFDETYRIVADYDLLFKAHCAALKFHYSFTPFAEFSVNGESFGNRARMDSDFAFCRARHFRLGENSPSVQGKPAMLPITALLPFLFHHDSALRSSARYFGKRWMWHHFRPVLSFFSKERTCLHSRSLTNRGIVR